MQGSDVLFEQKIAGLGIESGALGQSADGSGPAFAQQRQYLMTQEVAVVVMAVIAGVLDPDQLIRSRVGEQIPPRDIQ